MMVWIKLQTAWQLGLLSLYRYLRYRISVKSGLNPVRRLRAELPSAPFFTPPPQNISGAHTSALWRDEAHYFGWYTIPLHGLPPAWHKNPFRGTSVVDPKRPWWCLPDFDPNLGDIKTIWEPSRFDWVLHDALRARSGDRIALERLNHWLNDWLQHNPPYEGPNWKCGQESSLRVMHLALAAIILRQWERPSNGLQALIRCHLARIAPTIDYALAQNNNHGTSEAAALFIGGSWLYRQDQSDHEAAQWRQHGRNWLEERAKRLIAADGSFSQYSVNYHRMMLDTLSLACLWQQLLGEPPFSHSFRVRCQRAIAWLYAFTDPTTGDTPNLGANDGARLYPLTASDQRDCRPSLQVAAALFSQQRAYADHTWDSLLALLGIAQAEAPLAQPTTKLFDQGGYALLCADQSRVYIRYPRYRFRPAQSDALHVDVWLGSTNLLRDGGSYSYAAETEWQDYFRGSASHNTVQFDERDQMPRLGRFLYGAWLRTRQRKLQIKRGVTTFSAAYRDWQGAYHKREVTLAAGHLRVVDQISGFRQKAILRWRLCPGAWQRTAQGWQHGTYSVQLHATMPIQRLELVSGWESRYYMQRTPLPVIEMEVDQAGSLHSEFSWST
ncbi:heparinase II/III family protein [Candidatus Viridilinea mediisalina]|uniref:Heparinase n=1 Tax=Candidatus Viridilinea mediisalina TaxID=2024553 RepID=A0A2A6RGN2_9CHLR|nr:heparinase II/III-family protein [Candidatus Viridilinea mediisalina]PDW02020.1 heparinase [Candidatus Viridilinea mediisalina]